MIHFSNRSGSASRAWEPIFSLSLLAIPVSIAIAITRHRLWDIDLIIRRTLIYSVLTAALAIVYAGTIIAIQLIFHRLTESSGQSQPAIVISTLAVAALFTPLRWWVQERIDRHFFRRHYNAEKVLQSFAFTVRSDLDPEQVKTHLAAIIGETLEPEHLSIWILER